MIQNSIQTVGQDSTRSDALAKALAQLNTQRPAQQQQGGGMSPMQGFNLYQKFSGGEGFMGGGGGAAGGEAAGGGFGEAMSSAGPWAALAAAIIANEHEAREGGYRSEDDGDYAQDVLGGKVLEQDLNKRWLPDMFGEDLKHDDTGLGGDMKIGAELSSLDFGNALKSLKGGTLGKLWGKLT